MGLVEESEAGDEDGNGDEDWGGYGDGYGDANLRDVFNISGIIRLYCIEISDILSSEN